MINLDRVWLKPMRINGLYLYSTDKCHIKPIYVGLYLIHPIPQIILNSCVGRYLYLQCLLNKNSREINSVI